MYFEETSVYKLKGRPSHKPLAIAIGKIDDLDAWVNTITPDAQTLIDTFWPGPLTLVLPLSASAPAIINPGLANIEIRFSPSPIIKEFLDTLGRS